MILSQSCRATRRRKMAEAWYGKELGFPKLCWKCGVVRALMREDANGMCHACWKQSRLPTPDTKEQDG